jgi:hypothetical protein
MFSNCNLLKRLVIALAAATLATQAAAQTLPLNASITQNEGLLKHLYSFELPPGRQQYLGLTGTVSFTATEDHFGEALISVTYLQAGDCAAVNGTSYASYDSPGFPPLAHLAAFILKTPRAGTRTQTADIHFAPGVPITSCIVLVLDGGGAWGPNHSDGYTVTMTSALSLEYAPIPDGEALQSVAYGLGGELNFGPGPGALPSGSGQARLLRVNPAAASAFAVAALYGSASVSSFDGSSGEPVPTGYWGARLATVYYPSQACAAQFPVAGPWDGPLHVFETPITANSLPAGGRFINVQSLPGLGLDDSQNSFFQSTAPLTLNPGDCLLTLFRASANGIINLEDQATAILRPGGG